MYLFVFIFLLISIIGMYTSVYSLQVAKIFADQKAVAHVMNTWHLGARRFALEKIANGVLVVPPAGCFLSGSASLPSCVPQFQPLLNTGYLPAGYDNVDANSDGWPDNYTWITFISGNTPKYLITYVIQSILADPSSLISQPNIGYKVGDIYKQLQNTDIGNANYGIVKMEGGVLTLVTPAVKSVGGNITYSPLPAAPAGIPEGAVAIISVL